MKDLGNEAIDITGELLGVRGGFVMAVQGCKSKEDIRAKIEAGEDVKGIYITIVNGKATAAAFRVITTDDTK